MADDLVDKSAKLAAVLCSMDRTDYPSDAYIAGLLDALIGRAKCVEAYERALEAAKEYASLDAAVEFILQYVADSVKGEGDDPHSN